MPDTTAFYSQPTGFTLPGNHAEALAGLPADLPALAEIAHGLIVHEHMAGMYGFELADARRASVHVRPVSRLLDQIAGEDSRPLDVAREPSARVAGKLPALHRVHGGRAARPRYPGASQVRLRRVLRHGLA